MLLEIDLKAKLRFIEVVKGISFQIDKGKIVCLLGANGAGKSTTLRAISSLVPLTSGGIYLDGQRIDGLPPHHVVQRGITHVMEERRLFCEMRVQRNLEMGGLLTRGPKKIEGEP